MSRKKLLLVIHARGLTAVLFHQATGNVFSAAHVASMHQFVFGIFTHARGVNGRFAGGTHIPLNIEPPQATTRKGDGAVAHGLGNEKLSSAEITVTRINCVEQIIFVFVSLGVINGSRNRPIKAICTRLNQLHPFRFAPPRSAMIPIAGGL